MHIVLIPAWYAPASEGHTGIFVRDLAEQLAMKGHRVCVLSFGNSTVDKVFVNQSFEEHFIKLPYTNPLINFILGKRLIFNYFKNYLKTHGIPDVINSHGLMAIFYAVEIKNNFKISVVHTEHLSTLMQDRLPVRLRLMAGWLYARISGIISVSSGLTEKIRDLTSTDITTVPGIIHQSFFNEPLPERATRFANLICVSDFDERKGYKLLLHSLALVKKEVQEFKCLLVGDGPELESMKALTVTLGLQDHIVFCGKKDRKEIISLLAESNLYVTATKLESFGSHIAEALAMGLFVVTLDCKSVRSYVDESNGAIVKEASPLIFSEAVINAIQHNQHHNASKIRESIFKISAPGHVADQVIEVYQKYVKKTF